MVTASKRARTALVLSGGGARGAYQVGVLRGLFEQGFLGRERSGIDVFVGSSAGSINSAALAAHADDFEAGITRLERVWRGMHPSHVYRTDAASLGRIGLRWAWDLSFGGATRDVQPKALLDTSPLRALLTQHLPLSRIGEHVAAGRLDALAIVATDLHTSSGVIFLDGSADLPSWTRRRWRIERTAIAVDHLLASSAIPIFFPSVAIDGRHYGDGSIRNTAPLSPAINLGAQRIIAIGVSGPPPPSLAPGPVEVPTVAQIAGVLLDAVMLDAIEVDVEHSERVNASVVTYPVIGTGDGFRRIDVLWLRPSVLVRELASELADRIPPAVRYLLRGLGSEAQITELASYLLFDEAFCGRLLDLGREDVAADRDRIARFFAP
ncbi:MAG TPA: patatin-like phospholipase family protein [Candidatus Eisenbacteria bacterium]|nr:patatin-like phospholipase family protein [Candidatus Eisenbacteria bacterium]